MKKVRAENGGGDIYTDDDDMIDNRYIQMKDVGEDRLTDTMEREK